jgi:hypothetical protein
MCTLNGIKKGNARKNTQKDKERSYKQRATGDNMQGSKKRYLQTTNTESKQGEEKERVDRSEERKNENTREMGLKKERKDRSSSYKKKWTHR